jgi:pseudouridine kinase
VLFGPSNLDIYVSGHHRLHVPEYDTKTSFFPGGTCRNVAENLGRLGLQPTLVTPLGDDLPGRFIKEATLRSDVSFLFQAHSGVVTPVYLALTDGARIVAEMHDAGNVMQWFRTLDWHLFEDLLPAFDAAVVASVVPDGFFYSLASTCSSRNALLTIVMSDISTAPNVKLWLEHADIVVMNVHESKALLALNNLDAEESVRRLLIMGPTYVAVTDGAGRAFFGSHSGPVFGLAPLISVGPVISTIGAGDALAAGLLYGLLQKYPFDYCAKLGLAAAALSTIVPGPVNEQLSRQSVEGVVARYAA